MYIPSSTRSSQGIVSPEYVTFQPSWWLSATPNELGQCLTGTVLMFFMCRDANNCEYRSGSTLHLPMCCRTDKYYRLMYTCINSTSQNVEVVEGGDIFTFIFVSLHSTDPYKGQKQPNRMMKQSLIYII